MTRSKARSTWAVSLASLAAAQMIQDLMSWNPTAAVTLMTPPPRLVVAAPKRTPTRDAVHGRIAKKKRYLIKGLRP